MIKPRAIRLIVQILIFQIRICCSQSMLKYRLNEESEPGIVVGSLKSYFSSNFFNIDQYEILLMDDYFSISPSKDLVVKKQIDLERFCSEAKKCCNVNQCFVNLSVIINTKGTYYNRFNVEIEIVDLNDNEPHFKVLQQTVSIKENSNMGTSITLESGYDEDVSQVNQIQRYKFEEPTKTFEIDSSDLTSLALVLQKTLDYEHKRVYDARLMACDSATRCAYQKVVINIQDENDNSPIFEKKHYNVKILESLEVGQLVLQTRAKDLDGPLNNKIKYTITNNRNSNEFKINALTGDIVLATKLVAVKDRSYSFKVVATDASMTNKKDSADVVINVLDINDNRPKIEIYKPFDNREIFDMTIAENERPQKLISIRVSDEDLGRNAEVLCLIKDNSSSLKLKYFKPDLYEIDSVREYDYEQETQIKATFECKDGGSPALSSYKSITINIEDVNEFSPEFDKSEYQFDVRENCEPGEVVFTVRATDKDGGAILRYSIEESAILYFAINPITGVIKTASMSFDREQISSKTFRITVTDATNKPKSTEATVLIKILDENDNDPIFVPGSLQFFIQENQPVHSKLNGLLLANDADKDEVNSQISFYLIETFDQELKVCGRPFFRVKFGGESETVSVLDREANANFTLTIEARDTGQPQRLSRANVTVTVQDINDNTPQWIYPRLQEMRKNNANSIAMINLTDSTESFHLIMKLKAFDPDYSDAGRVSYILLNHHESLFTVNETTGELRTERSPLPYGRYELQFRAVDHGIPSRQSDSWIVVNVIDNGKLANINLTIIIGMVAITALISIFLIVAIICVRRRPRFHQSYLTPPDEAIKDQSSQYFSNSQWMYHPTDNNTMTHLADNESCIYLPASYYESQDALMFQSHTGSRPASRLEYPLVLPSSHCNNSENKYAAQSLQSVERSNGTLRSMNGQYCTINSPSSGIIINGQELDGDSADSGKGASEVDLRLQHHLNSASRNYPTMPFPHHSTATSTFGYQTNAPGQQYYSINTNPKSYDSRFLTMHPTNQSGHRRMMSPNFNSNKQCQCFILPEDDVIQDGHDGNQLPMTTFSQQSLCNFQSAMHDQSCIYRDDAMSSSGAAYYSNCPYIQGSTSRVSVSPIPFCFKDPITNDTEAQTRDDDKYNAIYETQKNIIYSSSEHLNQENNAYKLGLMN